MPESTVAIKGTKEGLLIALDPSEEWQVITTELASRLDGQSAFFAGARVTIDVSTRPVRKDELSSIKALLERRGMSLWSVASESSTTIDSANALDLRATYNAPQNNSLSDDSTPMFSAEEDGTLGVMIRRTLRSGRTVHSQGHVVVFGDVNPGSEIIAGGDVIVWGRLRGNVHAGANGDTSAIVCALDMTPTQLRIAGFITVSPPDKRRKPKPEIALIRDDQIVVETWQ
ncbi:putative septum site-determining protein MinC [uncultured bacterium]|nr:putative septum site-determining protein MinC [uncultured bacterium]